MIAVQQHGHAARAALQRLQRAQQRPGVLAEPRLEQVDRGEGFVHPHDHFVARLPAALHERQVQTVTAVAIDDAVERARPA